MAGSAAAVLGRDAAEGQGLGDVGPSDLRMPSSFWGVAAADERETQI